MTTRSGTLELQGLQVREGPFSTDLCARFQRSAQAFILALLEMVINGVSTRKVTHITEELCATEAEVSTSTVCALCARRAPLASCRPGMSGTGGRRRTPSCASLPSCASRRCPCAQGACGGTRAGAHGHGHHRAGLPRDPGPAPGSRAAACTASIWSPRTPRRLGPRRADARPGAAWQRCQAHVTRTIIDATTKALHKEMAARLRAVFRAADPFSARALLQAMHADFVHQAPNAIDIREEGPEDATAVVALPAASRVRRRPTNSAERRNEEIRSV